MRSGRPPRLTFAAAFAAGALLAAVAAQGAAPAPAPGPPPPPPSCFGAAARDPLYPCRNRALRLTVVPTPRAARNERNAPCNSLQRDGPVNVCAFGVAAAQATRTVALVGDSHASVWRAPLAAIAREQGWRGLSITRKSCPFSRATKRTPEPTRSHCVRWVKALPGFLGRHPEVDTLFVVALAGGKVVVPRGRTMTEAKISGYANAWRALPASVQRIVVIRDTPRITRHTVACVNRAIAAHRPAGRRCARPRHAALGPDPQVLAARRARSQRPAVIDLTRVLCGPHACLPVIGGALVYKDLHHLSRAFAETLAPQLGRALGRVARAP
ncbi:MAG: hypothetical protein QOD69_1684 [Solirubrobacteraceae bacterium]|nr:hypothetical protein [Solirubrobacteraceae bacterium]